VIRPSLPISKHWASVVASAIRFALTLRLIEPELAAMILPEVEFIFRVESAT